MQAVVKRRKGKGFVELMDMPMPEPGPGEVLIRVKAVAVCGSDLHIYYDRQPYWPPVILGHEFSGVVAGLGHGVDALCVGQSVVSETKMGTCQSCRFCLSGAAQMCPHKKSFGVGVHGAMASFVVASARWVHQIPKSVSFETADLTEPAAVCVHGLTERATIAPGDSVLVLGAGPIGLMACMVAKSAGARWIGVAGAARSAETRLKMALKVGADRVINVGEEDPFKVCLESTSGMGVDVAVEASGDPRNVGMALASLRRQGRLVAIGLSRRSTLEFPWDDAVFKAISAEFCFSSSWTSWERALALMASGALPTQHLITFKGPLHHWKEAFHQMEARKTLKALLIPAQ